MKYGTIKDGKEISLPSEYRMRSTYETVLRSTYEDELRSTHENVPKLTHENVLETTGMVVQISERSLEQFPLVAKYGTDSCDEEDKTDWQNQVKDLRNLKFITKDQYDAELNTFVQDYGDNVMPSFARDDTWNCDFTEVYDLSTAESLGIGGEYARQMFDMKNQGKSLILTSEDQLNLSIMTPSRIDMSDILYDVMSLAKGRNSVPVSGATLVSLGISPDSIPSIAIMMTGRIPLRT